MSKLSNGAKMGAGIGAILGIIVIALIFNILIAGALGAFVGWIVGFFFPTILGYAAWKFFAVLFIVLSFIRGFFS